MRRGRAPAVLTVAVRGAVALVAAGAAAVGAVPAVSAAVPAAGSWGKAIDVPGLRALNLSGGAEVVSVSCASAGSCAAVGHYGDSHGSQQGFVSSERHGRWGGAIEVPGLQALNKGGGADILSVSCSSAGQCAAGGYYSYDVAFFRVSAFVVSERGGQWGKAVAVPIGDGAIFSVSCGSAGNCLAGGDAAAEYFRRHNALLVAEQAGHWGHPRAVPGLRALQHVDSWVSSVACPSAGNCVVGGGYHDGSGHQRGFVAVETDGVWSNAIQVPGLAALSAGGLADVVSVSCGSAGNCAVGGSYSDGDKHRQGFVAVEQNGVWGNAIEVPGLGGLNKGGRAFVNSVSCGSAGNCAAGGSYAGAIVSPAQSGRLHGFVAVERNGVWGTAIQVPGLAVLNEGHGDTRVLTVSCAPVGSCGAGGFYFDRAHHRQGFVAAERNGVWGAAIRVAGLGALNAGGSAEVGSVSCPAPGSCVAGGYYTGPFHHHQGFVTQAAASG